MPRYDARLENILTAIQQLGHHVDTRLDAMSARLDAMNARLDFLADQVAGIKVELATHRHDDAE